MFGPRFSNVTIPFTFTIPNRRDVVLLNLVLRSGLHSKDHGAHKPFY